MIGISLSFPAGRFHATPWGRHVNEGAVEWPPSPWRILRALVATWKRTLPDLRQDSIEPTLRKLAEPPEFVLPPASTAHTRHYMPWFKKGPEDRTLVFDTFVVLAPESRLLVRWPDTSIEPQQLETLARILSNLNRLGRSESWCEAELATDGRNTVGRVCRPLDGDLPRDHEIVRLICPDLTTAFDDDHVVAVTTTTTGRGKDKRTVEERNTIYDPAWNLCIETLQLHKERWSDPPGSRRIPYARPRDCFRVESRPRARKAVARPCIEVARYVLDSSVLPLITETLPVAEAARRALMSIHGRLTERDGVRGRSDIFSGKDVDGRPLAGHRHARFLPTDEDGDGRLDHLTVHATGGFDLEERRALDRVMVLRIGPDTEARHPVRLLLLGLGGGDDYAPGPLETSEVWVSGTPYIATRYAKTRGRGSVDLTSPAARAAFLRDDLRAQLTATRPDLEEAAIEPLWDSQQVYRIAGRWRPIEFQRFRRKAGDDGGRRLAGTFRLTFKRPVRGPLALGFSSHFGMGLFMPETRWDESERIVIEHHHVSGDR